MEPDINTIAAGALVAPRSRPRTSSPHSSTWMGVLAWTDGHDGNTRRYSMEQDPIAQDEEEAA